MSIHLIGANRAVVAEGEENCIARIQLDLAAANPGDRFSRVVWLAPDTNPGNEHQAALIAYIKAESSNQPRTELLQTKLEELKSVVHAKLNESPAKKTPAGSGATQRSHIYLICDPRDLDALGPLQEDLFQRGFELAPSALEGDEALVRKWHTKNLRECDAALIYWGAANELWLRTKLADLRKAPGYARTKPMSAKAIYIAGPQTPEKARFRSHEVMVIAGAEASVPAQLEPFVALLGKAS
jgi:hypothetical protein